MATAPTDKDEVQREEVDPAKITEEVNEEAIESSLNQNRQEDSIAIRRSGETMGRGSTSSASQQNRGLVPSGAQMSQQMMMPRPYQQERPVAHFQMPRPYQQEGSVAPFQMSQQMMMSHLRPSVPPYQQERPVAPVQNEFTQPFGMQRGKRKLYEAGESSSSRKRQNQQHLWQIEAPRDSEGYQEYLERLGGSSGGSLGAFSARHPLNQRRQNQPPWMNYTNQPQQQAVRPVMNYNQPQQQAARPWMNYTNQPQQQAVRPAMNYTNQPQQQAVRPWINYNNQPQQQGVRNYNNQPPWMNYNYQPQQQRVRPVINYNYHHQPQQFNQRFGFPVNMIQHHQASPSAAVPPRPEQNQQLQPQTQQPRQFQGSSADEPSSSGQGQG